MKLFLLTILLITLFGCNTPKNKELIISESNKVDLPANWKIVNECGIRFYIPMDLKEEEVRSVDSCGKQYENENIKLTFDVLDGQPGIDFSRSNEYLRESNFRVEKAVIGNQHAEIITFANSGPHLNAEGLDYGAVLDIPQMNLTMWAYS